MVIGKEVHHQQVHSRTFIPPRKRQSNKKCTGSQNYVDHIVTVQGRSKQSPTTDEESTLVKSSSSLLLQQSIDSIVSCDLNAIRPALTRSNEHNLHELHHINATRTSATTSSQQSKETSVGSCAATPSTCYSAESINVEASANKKRVVVSSSSSGKGGEGQLQNHKQQQRSQRQQYRSSPQSTGAIYDELLLASGDGSTTTSGGNDGRQLSFSRYTNTIGSASVRTESYLTMTGTVKRGRKKGQSVDLQINMSRDELEKINTAALVAVEETAAAAAVGCCQCTRSVGLHVLLLSILCLPFVTLATGVYSFYIGTLTWYNMFNYLNEERSVWLRVLVSPVLVLMYPLLIVLCTLGLGVYAGVVQLSLRFNSWLNEIGDVEKGFYGWLCAVLRMSDCSPYEVVVLVDLTVADRLQPMNSSTEELSL